MEIDPISILFRGNVINPGGKNYASIKADSKGVIYYWDKLNSDRQAKYVLKYIMGPKIIPDYALISGKEATYIYQSTTSNADFVIDANDVLWVDTVNGWAQYKIYSNPRFQQILLNVNRADLDGAGLLADRAGNLIVTSGYGLQKFTAGQPLVVNNLNNWNCIIGQCSNNPGCKDGSGQDAKFQRISALVEDKNTGIIYALESENNAIRKITYENGVYTSQMIAGGNSGWIDGLAPLKTYSNNVNYYDQSPAPPANTPGFTGMTGLTIDSNGNLYTIANGCIRKISPTNTGEYLVRSLICDLNLGNGTASKDHTSYARLFRLSYARSLLYSNGYLYITIAALPGNIIPSTQGKLYKIPIY
jgi:hypothetical protein